MIGFEEQVSLSKESLVRVHNLIHDDPLKKEYQESDRYEKMGYEERWIASLEDVIGDVDKKIKRGHQRLAMTQESEPSVQGSGPRQDQIKQLSSKIGLCVVLYHLFNLDVIGGLQ